MRSTPPLPTPSWRREGGTPGSCPTGCCSMSTSRTPSRPWPPLARRWRPVTQRAYQEASHAASRLRGPFLAGRHGLWVDEQRDRLSDLLVAALEVASEAAAASGDAAMALALADDAVERAPLRRAPTAPHAGARRRWQPGRGSARLPAPAPGPGRHSRGRSRHRHRGGVPPALGAGATTASGGEDCRRPRERRRRERCVHPGALRGSGRRAGRARRCLGPRRRRRPPRRRRHR